jgi:hypothetical protein
LFCEQLGELLAGTDVALGGQFRQFFDESLPCKRLG